MPGSAKNYCWTYNRPGDTPDETWEALIERMKLVGEVAGVIYHVFQHERGDGTERDHLQGYTSLDRRCTMITVKRDFFMGLSVWLTPAKGTPQQNKTYCTKVSTRISGPWEFGAMPAASGRRTDLEDAAEIVQTRGPAQVAIDFPALYIRHYRGLHALDSQLQRLNAPVLRDPCNCAVMWGPTDLGKSHAATAMDSPLDTFIVPIQNTGNIWFDGYNGQRTVIFDDFDPKTVPFRTLLRICDRFRLEIPVKGGFVLASWTNVIFTANLPPHTWYNEAEMRQIYRGGPLERRLGLVHSCATRPDCGLFKAAFITRFFPEIPLDEDSATVVPEVVPEVDGNIERQPRESVAETQDFDFFETEDADAFVGGFDPEALDAYEAEIDAELAAFDLEDLDPTQPFGSFQEE